MKIATWNVNSIKVRLPALLAWVDEAKPDVVLLQEIKCVDKDFPALELKAAGYHTAVHAQKTYNGVAILSRAPLADVKTGLPQGEGDDHARWIEATVEGVRVVSLYLPNG